MSIRALIRAIQHLLSQTSKLAQRITKKIVTGFLRNLLLVGRRPRMSRAGFVLPTTVLLLLVATLTVGSITYRTYTRTAQTIGDRQQRVIYNAATPAIDRARAKLEFLFDPQKDPRFPGGIPGEGRLLGMLLNDGSNGVQELPGDDVYTIPGETRVDINGDGNPDNAWIYEVDTDEDTVTDATVAYSILFKTPVVSEDPDDDELPRLTDPSAAAVEARADKLQVRQGPLSSVDQLNNACRRQNLSTLPESGWIPDGVNTATLRKNFQIDAFVLPKNPTGTVTTLEFYQDRQVDRGNKWGAWFRNDLEIFPGSIFNWNGAMHTEGSLIVGKPQPAGKYTSYMISSPASCLYVAKSSSEVSVAFTTADDEQEIPAFTGQIISGLTGKNDFSGESQFHIFQGAGRRPNTAAGDTTLEEDTDSIGNDSGGEGAADFALDPVALLTKGISVARNAESDAPQDPNWQDTALNDKGEGRIFNKFERAPYVDDSFRADNRYGPKPRYENKKLPDGVNIGDAITGDLMQDVSLPDDRLTDDVPANADDDTSVGLDGYWERRARVGGLRLVVGQRLELGNPYPETLGGYSTSFSSSQLPRREPLRPWAGCEPASINTSGRCNEARQRRTLIDNLAAVQATTVYHAASGNPDFPLACLATTAHPGTSVTLDRSTTFEDLAAAPPANGSLNIFPLIISDFFSGRGTNGWEYEPPREASFPDAELTKALKNLAYFAGDPNGGAPSFNPLQDSNVHPYPSMAMWGDFSMLRRVLGLLDSGTSYSDLSPADKTTLHTAACALGMLAYNLNYLSSYDYRPPNPNLNTLATKIRLITDGTPANSGGVNLSGTLPPEAYIDGLKRWRANDTNEGVLDTLIPLAQLIMEKEQVERDRARGFGIGESQNCTLDFSNVPGVGSAASQLAKLCSSQPKYPILYSLFPGDNNGNNVIAADDRHGEVNGQSRDLQDSSDLYISSKNGAVSYEVVDLSSIQLAPRQLNNWITPHVRYTGTHRTTTAAPTAPYTTANNNRDVLIKECVGTGLPCYRTDSGNLESISFKDSGIYNPREMMNVRVLDINLELLRSTPYNTNFWLPESGIIYAFREDAVSESSIVRPSSGGGACDSNASFEPEGSACHMQGTGTEAANDSTDPPLGAYSISPKPVDYYPDPDRRPYGFRLRKGASLWRGSSLSRPGDEGRGMSFITDNAVYIQGDFNLHRTLAEERLEEFQDQLPNDVYNENDFYGRTNIEQDFANPTADQWRPTEILADAVTILSDNFCDGSIEDGIITAGEPTPNEARLNQRLNRERAGENGSVYGCRIGNTATPARDVRTSYLNQNRPNRDNPTAVTLLNGLQARWLRVDRYNTGSPILISRNGNPVKASANVSNINDEYGSVSTEGYYATSANRPYSNALDGTRVNATIISGIVPSRTNQAYGGMHNFPRLLENWAGRKLNIAGSFLQLNFSNYATGPYDQDAFEVGSPASPTDELVKYYEPPLRLWGYDVGLQYAPAGPLAQRFVTFTSIRSEFYNEPPANDPYISNLCNAIDPARCPA